MHHQGIFRIPGAQVEINEFKAEFEKGLTVVTNNRISLAISISRYWKTEFESCNR